MQEAGPAYVKSPYDLSTYQRRLRHVRSITLRNLQCKSYKGKDITKLQVYFTVHTDGKLKEFYKSEEIHGSLNPSWQSFDISRFEEEIDIQQKSFVIRIWVQNEGIKDSPPHLLIDWTIHLSGLVFFSDKLQHDRYKYIPNMVVVGMFDKYFIAPEKPLAPDRDVVLADPGPNVRSSYTVNSLSRIYTVLRAISQMQASVKRVHRSIEDKLLDSHEKSKKRSAREDMICRVNQMKGELGFQMNKLQHLRDVHENCRKAKEEQSQDLKVQYQQLENNKANCEDKRKTYFQTREKYIKENYQLLIRRKQLISELTTYIYPLTELKDKRLCICGVHLPNSEFQGQDDVKCAVSLGYACHLVGMMSHILDFPLRYSMEHLSSRSNVTDHIHPMLSVKEKTFPLYLKGKEKFQFNYGVYLLNKNISQLRFYCGLGTTDLRLTLPNIKSMLESRLGIKFDHLERSRLDIKDSNSVTSTEKDETASSLASGGKNAATHRAAEEALEITLTRNGSGQGKQSSQSPDTHSTDDKVHSTLPLTELSASKENIPTTLNTDDDHTYKNSNSNSSENVLKLKSTAFVDSVENSSCDSYPDKTNGVIGFEKNQNHERNFSLSPSPGSVENSLSLLTPVYTQGSTSPVSSLKSDEFRSSPVEPTEGSDTQAPPGD